MAQGQNYVIVGAGGGIGAACAERLAADSRGIVCMDLDPAALEETARRLRRGTGAEVTGVEIDVRDEGLCAEAVSEAVSRLGEVHGLIYAPGITGRTGIKTHEVDVEDFDEVYRVNLRGAFLVSKAILPHMVERRYGRILHIASISGKEGNEGMAAYSSTKAGLIGLVKVLGKEYATYGITVNALAPAVIRTPMVESLPDEQVEYMTAKIPMKRTGTLEEVAAMAAWIVSPHCSFTTAFTFDLSGGRAVY